MNKALWGMGLVVALSGCAHYAPDPLGSTVPATTPEALWARESRPYLTPITVDLSQPLDSNAVATIAVIANPDLKALRARADISDAQVFSAGLLPDPTFSAGADTVLSGPDTKTNITAALGLDLNALRTRGVARAQTQAENHQVRLDLAWSEWQTSGQARLQAVRVQMLERQLALNAASRNAQEAFWNALCVRPGVAIWPATRFKPLALVLRLQTRPILRRNEALPLRAWN